MSEQNPRPRALVAIVIYKCFTVGLLACVAIGLFLTSKKYDDLFAFSEEYMMTGKREIIKAGLTQVISTPTTRMQLGAVIAAVYAAVNGIEAVGLWNQNEIIHKASIVKFVVFAVNIAMFVYLLRHALEERQKRLEHKH
jgi:uncharacterized membrane protein (DUF2068 family)